MRVIRRDQLPGSFVKSKRSKKITAPQNPIRIDVGDVPQHFVTLENDNRPGFCRIRSCIRVGPDPGPGFAQHALVARSSDALQVPPSSGTIECGDSHSTGAPRCLATCSSTAQQYGRLISDVQARRRSSNSGRGLRWTPCVAGHFTLDAPRRHVL